MPSLLYDLKNELSHYALRRKKAGKEIR